MSVEAPERDETHEQPGFAVAFQQVGPLCLLSLEGDLHAGTVGVLESEFDRLGRTACARVVLDVSALVRIDRTGARVLAGLGHYVQARGGHLSVLGATPWVAAALSAEEMEPA